MTSGVITDCSDPLSDDSISICHVEGKSSETKSSDNIYHCLLNDFYGFEHHNTKWILTALSSPIGLKRLQLCKEAKFKMLRSYYEIPDNPKQYNILNKESLTLNTPAFHPLASLYLNPLGISIYIRNESALRIILSMEVNSFSDPCFVQKWWSKGQDKYLTDFSTINVLALALRRNFMEGISIMMLSDLNPKDRFYHVEHIQSSNSSKTHVYQDGLDLAFNMLNDRPGLDIGRYFKIIVDKRMKHYYHIISYEMNTVFYFQKTNTIEKIRLCSSFRMILKRAVQSQNYKFSSKYLTILEIMQLKGFFRYLQTELKENRNENALIQINHTQFCEESFNPGDEIESQRIFKSDLLKLPMEYRIGCLLLDRKLCIGLLIIWLLETKKRERHNLKNKLAKLIVNVLIDSSIIIWFLQTPDNTVAEAISTPCCKVGPISKEEIFLCKSLVIDIVRQSNRFKTKIYKKINKVSSLIRSLTPPDPPIKRKPSGKKPSKHLYLECNSHTMQSWNQPKDKSEQQMTKQYKSEEIPILSLKHKLGKMIPNLTMMKSEINNKPPENQEPIEKTFADKNTCSGIVSLDSFAEISYVKPESLARYLPPPLIVSRQKSMFVNSIKVTKRDNFSAGDNPGEISITTNDDQDTTVIERNGQHDSLPLMKHF